jgi:hypothetical protein
VFEIHNFEKRRTHEHLIMTEQEYLSSVEDSIAEIKSIDFNESDAYEKVVDALLNIQKLPIILYKMPEGDMIYRARINPNNKLFTKVSEISAPKEKYVLKYGRANQPSQVIFYGSETRPVAYLEFVTHLAETTPIGKEAIITIGAWQLAKELKLVLIFNPSLPRDNYYNQHHGEAFDDFISKMPSEYRKGTNKFFDFIGEEYAKLSDNNDETYKITCAYSNIIYSHSDGDGLIYPSVQFRGEGFNVALKKDVVAAKNIQIDSAMADKFIAKQQENGKHNFINNASIHVQEIKEDNLEWEDDWAVF